MHKIETPVNFRDLGGFVGRGGKTVRERKILRSAEVYALNAQDQQCLLNDYDLRTIIDLRNDLERKNHPNDTLPVNTIHINLMDTSKQKFISENMLEDVNEMERTRNSMLALYRAFITQPHVSTCYRQFVDAFLEQEEGAILFHCYAGQDRTGIMAAVILTLLGVSDNDIMKDYLYSNVMRNKVTQKLLEDRKNDYRIEHQEEVDEDQEAVFLYSLTIHNELLQTSFYEASRLYGSFYNYCLKTLRIKQEELGILEDKYLR